MNSIVTVQRAIIQLGKIDLDVFRLPDLSYRLSESGCERAVDAGKNHILYFRRSKNTEALPFKGLTIYKGKVANERTTINLVPFNLAIAYWGKEATRGNSKAMALILACAKEALERRADAAFAIQKTEHERNEDFADFMARWEAVRHLTKVAHAAFVNACKHKNHPGNLVHDMITKIILGDTAAEARLKPLIDGDLDPKIGLNHQEDIINLGKLAEAKLKYANLKKGYGTWQEQAQRACAAVM
jgi:hypothetical protein